MRFGDIRMEFVVYMLEALGVIGLVVALAYVCANYICTNI